MKRCRKIMENVARMYFKQREARRLRMLRKRKKLMLGSLVVKRKELRVKIYLGHK